MAVDSGQGRPDSVDLNGRDAGSGGPLFHRTDLGLALIILAACAGLYYATTRFETVAPLFAQDVPPEFFPRLLIWTIVVLTLLLPFEHLLLAQRRKNLDADRSDRIRPNTLVTAALLCAVVAAMPWLGTAPSMVVICLLLPRLWGETRLRVLVPFAVVFPAAVTVVFSNLLKVHFEPGLLGLVFR